MNRHFVGSRIIGTGQVFAINGNCLPVSHLENMLYPVDETGAKWSQINSTKAEVKGVVGRGAVGAFHQSSALVVFRMTQRFNSNSAIGTTDAGAASNPKHIHQLMPGVAIIAAGGGSFGKIGFN